MPMSQRASAEFFGTFWLAPLLGAAAAGIVYPRIVGRAESPS